MVLNKDDFNLWLDQEVWVRGDYTILRREYIPHFAEEVRQFMKDCGYTMDHRWKKGELILAKWMYRIHFQECVKGDYGGEIHYPPAFHRDWVEDHDEFLHIMSADRVSSFMERWRLYQDFDPDSRIGQRMIHEITSLLYIYIDMEASMAGRRIAELLEEGSESESDDKGRVDIYISDSRQGYHGSGSIPIA